MDVIVVGSCNIDLISYVPCQPKPGETIYGTECHMGFGGKGANQCVMASRLGASTAMIAKVGDDMFGHNTIKNFKDNNISVDHVLVTDKAASGVAPISVDKNGENAIIVVPGANNHLTVEDVRNVESLIKSSSVLMCQLEVPVKSTLEALKLGKKHGVITMLNAAPAHCLAELSEAYNYTDLLCVNETEAETLLGCHPLEDIDAAKRAVTQLYQKFVLSGCVLLTLGSQGLVYAADATSSVEHIPAEKVTAVDTTGAGDAFVGALGFYFACYKSLPLKEKIKRATKIASKSVTRKGTQPVILAEMSCPMNYLHDEFLCVYILKIVALTAMLFQIQ